MQHSILAALVALLVLSGSARVWAQAQTSGNAFNPAFSLILNGNYSSYSLDPEAYGISGFALAEEAGPSAEGFSIDETELVMSANIDDKFYGFATIALEQDAGETEVELEEVWFETLALPSGLKLKAGRFLSDIGYLNAIHPHAWDFVDAPLAYTAMLGSGFADTGVQFRWLAPTAIYLELGAELARGDSFPAAGSEAAGGDGVSTLFAHVGGDVGASHSWRAGLSFLSAQAHDRESEFDGGLMRFDGDSDVTIIDFVWKWARNGNARERNFVVQAELVQRDERGDIAFDDLMGLMEQGAYDGDQDGWYLQGVYQFRPRWRVGLRFDRLSSDNRLAGFAAPPPLATTYEPRRASAMVDFSNSEYSRLRIQWNRDESRPESDDQIFVQYLMSLGAHGAHRF
jgi:hypothetical protein